MATRFYLPSTGAAALTPAYSAEWTDTTFSIGKLAAVVDKISSAMTTQSVDDADETNKSFCFGMWVSDPLAAQTISAQQIATSIRCSETGLGNNMGLRYTIRIVQSDGVTFRGTALALTSGGVEANTSLRSLYKSTLSSEVVCQDNDRVVIEVGMGGDPGVAQSHDSSMSFGDDSANDLTADNTDTDPDNPWVEFANTLTFLAVPSSSVSPSVSPSASPSNSPSLSPSSSASPSNSPSLSPSSSASPSNSPSVSPSISPSVSPSLSPSSSASRSNSPSNSPSLSPSSSASRSLSPSASRSPSSSASPSASRSQSPSSSASRSQSPSSSASRSQSPSASLSPSSSASASPSASPSAAECVTGFEVKGIGVNIYNPLIRGGTFINTITHLLRGYTHTISALGGFAEATIQISGDQTFIEDWYTDGIGRHIVVTNQGGRVCWEGFVNSVEVHMGAYSATRGPLLNIANRASSMYTPILVDPITGLPDDPPEVGVETETVIAEDLNSQQRYGIWEKVISAGQVFDDDAEYIRDTFLEDNREPEVNASISLGGGGDDASVTLHCRGYIDWLNYAYNDPTSNSVTATTKIGDVVTAEPNAVFSTDQSGIDTNGILVWAYEDGNRMARVIVDEIVSMGDINDNRWLYGCYEDQKVFYYAAPTDVEYSTHLTHPQQDIYYLKKTKVDPWDVRPGKWLELLDFRALGITPTNMRENPSLVFIEEVQFTSPNQVSLSGAKIKKVTQLLARMGLG